MRSSARNPAVQRRLALLLAAAVWVTGGAGCFGTSTSEQPFPGGPGGDAACRSDRDCASGEVCARDASCWSASQVHAVHVDWTVGGAPASATTCEPQPMLEIEFRISEAQSIPHLAYAPVPCVEGRFSVDKLPTSFTFVTLGSRTTLWSSSSFGAATSAVLLDLTL